MIKLIASDMDGTLLNHNHKIPKENVELINYAKNQGIEFVVATGRAYYEALPALNEENINCDVISFNGGIVYDKNGNIIHQNYKKLSECDIETTATFRALIESSKDFLEYLNLKELSLGTKIKVLHKETFDNNITISYLNRVEIISNIVAEKLLVEP